MEANDDKIFPHARLRPMHCGRYTTRKWRAFICGINPLLIHRMTCFVHAAEEGCKRVARFKTICNADIVHAERGLKWMRGFILPAAVEIIPKPANDDFAEIPYFLFIIFFVEEIILYLFGGTDLFDQPHLLRAQAAKISCTSAVFMPGS